MRACVCPLILEDVKAEASSPALSKDLGGAFFLLCLAFSSQEEQEYS